MKGRVSGNRKRLAAVARLRYMEWRWKRWHEVPNRDLPLNQQRQDELDWASASRWLRLEAHAQRQLSGH